MSCTTLTGKYNINEINLTGKTLVDTINEEPYYITRLKKVIFNRFITPIFTKNWAVVEKNMFSLQDIRLKLNHYIKNDEHNNFNTNEDLSVYLSFLDVVVELLSQYKYYKRLEGVHNPKNTLGTIGFNIPQIRLQPEYELYKLILGRPSKTIGYNKETIAFIKSLLEQEYIEYSAIENLVLERFSNNK